MIGVRLKRRREELGLGFEEVALAARVSGDRLASIEAEGEEPYVSELARLGPILGIDAMALLRGEETSASAAIRFRAPDGVDHLGGRDARILANAAELGRVGRHLWNELRDQSPRVVELREVRAVDASIENWEQGYSLGERARKALTESDEPLDSVQSTLERAGVHVCHASFSSDAISATSLLESDALPVVILNRSAKRKSGRLSRRATLAHELCHLLHDGTHVDLLTMVSRYEADEPLEQRANGFAPSFIAPRPAVRSWFLQDGRGDLDPYDLVARLSHDWGFTWEGASWHAKNCRLIDADVAAILADKRQHVSPGRFERDAGGNHSTSGEFSLCDGLIGRLVDEAVEAGLISNGRAVEIRELGRVG